MPTWEWTLVTCIAIAYLAVEARAVRWALRRITTSEAARRNGTLQAAVADEYLKDAKRLEVDVRYYGFGVPLGVLLAVFSVVQGTGIGWMIFGIATALLSFGGVGARAVYGNLRFRSIGSFYGDLIRLR
jgi:hypothetical protein